MGKAEFGTAKYLSKQMKAKGLQRLKFYCQVCRKQCRDENGFKSHIRSPSHLKNITNVSQADIEEYTRVFEADFLRLLRLAHGEKKIEANKFYNEFIQDKDHIHMNATRFTSLTKFVQHLGKSKKILVHGIDGDVEDDMDPGSLLISYVDNSHENVLRKAKLMKFSQDEKSEQDIKAKLLQRQIEHCLKQNEETEVEDEEQKLHMVPVQTSICIDLKSKRPNQENDRMKKKLKKNKAHKNVFKH